MPRARLNAPLATLAAAGVLAAGALAGCGSGGGGTTDTGGAEAREKPPHTMVGVRGEARGAEAATSQHISHADCLRLRHLAEGQSGIHLQEYDEPTPPNSRCRLTGPGTTIGIYLDSGRSAHQRYRNRMTEQNQFAGADPGRLIHPVAQVGEPGYGNENASWVPDVSTLFAARGNRWLTVAYGVGGVPTREARDRAAALAILGFQLTARR